MKYIIIAISILMLGCKVHQSPGGKYFPYHWGEPPEIQTKDYRELPAGYGHGSSTLKNWIELNIEKDKLGNQQKEINLKLLKLSYQNNGMKTWRE
jgi:hypothetical protein